MNVGLLGTITKDPSEELTLLRSLTWTVYLVPFEWNGENTTITLFGKSSILTIYWGGWLIYYAENQEFPQQWTP